MTGRSVIASDPTTADALSAAVLAVPDVVRLHGGRFGEVATYLPGRRVVGITISEAVIDVHVEVGGLVPVTETARLIRASVTLLTVTPAHVHIEDVAGP